MDLESAAANITHVFDQHGYDVKVVDGRLRLFSRADGSYQGTVTVSVDEVDGPVAQAE